jgi:hypothetical protein
LSQYQITGDEIQYDCMTAIEIQQAIFSVKDADCQLLARSSGFREDWLSEAERVCLAFAQKRNGTACPACVFARPFGRRKVVVVQAGDLGTPGRGALGFRFLLISSKAYLDLGGDPFLVADRFPPPWQTRGDMPALAWPVEPPPRRTVEEVCKVLKRPVDGPNLLGGSQALVDGSRIVFERPGPDAELLRDLWALLPTSSRAGLWPASFAFDNALDFDVVVVSRATPEEYPGYLTEQQAGDYPEGRYELGLQVAAEAGDQRELDILFARRSRRETWRLGLILLVVISLLLGLSSLLGPVPAPKRVVPPTSKPGLPPADHKSRGR